MPDHQPKTNLPSSDAASQQLFPKTDWTATARQLGEMFAKRASEHDLDGSFVAQNYDELRAARVLSAAIPAELGGGGASYAEICDLLRELAKHCPSTALSLAMHMHLVAASVFKLRNGAPEEALQTRIANEQIFLVSTGATDWVDSNGTMEKVEDGYLVSGRKVFASGAPTAAVMVTSARYEDPEEGAQVLHFPIPFSADGVEIQDDWNTLGMRGTGSHSVVLEKVFVPEDKIALRRPAGAWHPVWNVVLTVALPIILSVYRGIAEKARDLAVAKAAATRAAVTRTSDRTPAPFLTSSIGELDNALATAQIAVDSMVAMTNNYDVKPSLEIANAMLIRKTIAAEAAAAAVQKAIEVAGGSGFYRTVDGIGLEQLFRDVQAAAYHPLARPRQLEFSGRVALDQSPVAT